MSNNERTNGFHSLKVSNFDHSSTIPCATRWREWEVKLNQEQEQKLYIDFQKAQYSLLHVLPENFGTHDKQIIADHDHVQLVEKLKAKHTVDGTISSSSFPTSQDGHRQNG